MNEQVRLDRRGGLLVITLDRPERRNAMTPQMTHALTSALANAAADDAVRAVMLTGGGGHFCVGGDVKAMHEGSGQDRSLGERIHALRDRMSAVHYLYTMPKPTIAAIEGSAAGAGLSLALACDLRVCAEDAKLTTAFANVALSGDFGGSYFLTHILGPAKAREYYLLSPRINGIEAERIGLVTRCVPAANVQATAIEMAERLAEGPTQTYRRMKQNLTLAAEGASLAECLDREALNHIVSSTTEDHREAAAAFVEKRQPIFQGR